MAARRKPRRKSPARRADGTFAPKRGRKSPARKRRAPSRRNASGHASPFDGTLTFAERDALAKFAANYGRTWKAELLKRRMHGDDMPAAIYSAFAKIGPSGIKKYKVPRSSAAYHRTPRRSRL